MYVWRTEKDLAIKHARKCSNKHALSDIVIIKDGTPGYCVIRFPEYTVKILGKKMPFGLGPENKAYFSILKMHDHYDICLSYLDNSKSIRLWRSDNLPKWVKNIKYP